jgi:hypothetical protein
MKLLLVISILFSTSAMSSYSERLKRLRKDLESRSEELFKKKMMESIQNAKSTGHYEFAKSLKNNLDSLYPEIYKPKSNHKKKYYKAPSINLFHKCEPENLNCNDLRAQNSILAKRIDTV